MGDSGSEGAGMISESIILCQECRGERDRSSADGRSRLNGAPWPRSETREVRLIHGLYLLVGLVKSRRTSAAHGEPAAGAVRPMGDP